MRFIAILALLAIGTFLSCFSFVWAASTYLWVNIFQPLGFAYRHGAFPIAISVFTILLISYLLAYSKGLVVPKLNRMIIFSVLFIFWLTLSAVFSPFQDAVWSELWIIIKYITPLMLISSGLSSFKDILIVSITLVLSVGIWSAQAGVKGLLSGVTTNMAIKFGQMSDNNDFMAATVGILPFLLFFPLMYKGKYPLIVKVSSFGLFALSLIAIIFSNSRGAAIGVAGLSMFYLLFISMHKTRDFWVLIAFGIISFFFVPDSFWERMHSIDLSLYTQTEASAMSRLHLMKSAFQCALDHPILGIGPNSWIYIAESYAGDDTEPHSAYIKLAAESGFIGLSIYIFLISNTVSRLLNQRKAYLSIDNYQQAIFSTILAMTLTGIAIPFIFLNHPYSEFLWAWIAVSWSYLSLQPPTSKTEEHGLSIGNITVLR